MERIERDKIDQQKERASSLKVRKSLNGKSNCHDCGKEVYSETGRHNPKSIILHHIIPVLWGGKSNGDNLIVLCNECHKIRHRILKEIGLYLLDRKHTLGKPLPQKSLERLSNILLRINSTLQKESEQLRPFQIKLSKMREQLKMTRKQFAHELGVDYATLWRWENQKRGKPSRLALNEIDRLSRKVSNVEKNK